MNVAYKCRCMPNEETIFVRDRKPDEDIVDWVEQICGRAIAEDHIRRSPRCRSTKMEYAKFEVDPSGGPLGTITRN